MPRTNLSKNPNQDKDKTLLKAIRSGLIDNDMPMKVFIKKTGIPQSTVYADLKKPESAPIYRVRTYFDVLRLSADKRTGIL